MRVRLISRENSLHFTEKFIGLRKDSMNCLFLEAVSRFNKTKQVLLEQLMRVNEICCQETTASEMGNKWREN